MPLGLIGRRVHVRKWAERQRILWQTIALDIGLTMGAKNKGVRILLGGDFVLTLKN